MRKLTGLAAMVLAGTAWAQVSTDADGVYTKLQKDVAYIHPSAVRLVDLDKIQAAADRAKPLTLKVLVVPSLGGQWVRNGQERRGEFARYVLDKKLSLNGGIVIVFTQKGMTAYSDKLGNARLSALNNQAVKNFNPKDMTNAIVGLSDSISQEANRKSTTRTGTGGTLAALALVGIGSAVAIGVGAKKLKLKNAREGALTAKNQAIEAISYLDSYADLLPDADNKAAVMSYRKRAYDTFEDANARLLSAKKAEDFGPIANMYAAAKADAELGKPHIEAATNGTKVAFTVPPKFDPSSTDAPLFAPYQDVCYFTGRPGHGDLVPVTINLDGQRRTVMASPEALAETQQFGEPRMRGMYDQGRFVPWYMVRGYDPYTSYGSRDFIWDALAMSAMVHMFNPFWSTPMIMGGYYGGYQSSYFDSGYGGYGGSGGGVDSSMSDLNQSGDFGGSFDFGSGGFDAGGSDFGGGDFGGGDFGGGDF